MLKSMFFFLLNGHDKRKTVLSESEMGALRVLEAAVDRSQA